MNEPVQEPSKWYYSNWSLLILFVTAGPFAIPLVWKNPRYKKGTQWFLTAVIIVLTVLISWAFGYFVQKILAYYKLLSETAV